MGFTVTCSCGKKLAARAEHVGKRAKCPDCGQVLVIASPELQPAPPSSQEVPTAAVTVMSSAKMTVVAGPPASSSPMYDGHPLDHWFELLGSADPAERRKAADVLAGVGPEAAGELKTLTSHSRSPHVLARHWAAICIGQIGPAAKHGLPALLDRLDDEQPLVREKAVAAIGQVSPDAKPFLPRLLRELNAKDGDRRQAAIGVFRRDLQTAGVSRFRFWACACGRVYIKVDLEERLRKLVEAPDTLNWDGQRACGQCGAAHRDRDIYAGNYDVPQQHWPKLRSKFGKQLSVPDDFFDDTKVDAGYQLSDEAGTHDHVGAPSPGVFSLDLGTAASLDADQGYAIADAPPPPVYGPVGPNSGGTKVQELVPGATVPATGKYKCTACTKRRLSGPADEGATKALARASVVMPFKAGKTFSECPKCGDLTEWELLG